MLEPVIHHIELPNPPAIFKKDTGMHRLAYFRWGDEGSERKALCVHGMTRNSRDFDCLANALVAQGYAVYALDIVGRGQSDHLQKPKHYGYPLYCADVMEFCCQLNLYDVDFIGTSMGGLIGMMIAAGESQADAGKKIISRLILNDIGPFIPKESLMRIGSYIGQKMGFGTWQEAEEYYRQIMVPFGVREEEHWQHLLKHAFKQREDGAYEFVYDRHIGDGFWNNRGKQRKLPDMDLWAMWEHIKLPTYVIRGGESDLLPKKVADRMRKSDWVKGYVEFSGIGHAPMLMDEEQIDAVLEFLKSH